MLTRYPRAAVPRVRTCARDGLTRSQLMRLVMPQDGPGLAHGMPSARAAPESSYVPEAEGGSSPRAEAEMVRLRL